MTIPSGYSIRKVQPHDYQSYTDTLKELTTVGKLRNEDFEKVCTYWASLPEIYHPMVIVNGGNSVVATGMLLVEQKIIHQCGHVGHIEDIAVAGTEQGKKLGMTMISELTRIAKAAGCYKVILDCSPHNVQFYEKCGYKESGVEMVKRFD